MKEDSSEGEEEYEEEEEGTRGVEGVTLGRCSHFCFSSCRSSFMPSRRRSVVFCEWRN